MSVVIETSIGDIVIDLYIDERPSCCKNFLKLCKMKYYNFCLFHSIQKNYIAQAGDPTGTGRGGESVFNFAYGDQARYFEMEKFPIIKHKKKGTVSMINNNNDMHGSQFLITLAENLDFLDGKHTIFGEVAKGLDILEKLNDWICDKSGRPYQDIRIFHTVILDDPFDDFAALKELNGRASPEPTDERLKSERIRVDEEIDQLDDMTPEEIDKYMKEREAKTRAKLLEIIGDLPDADMKPPENVLFVCKLNQVTTDEDLELIFSRFGKINSCEVIRDSKTGDSLCYAFIEFDRQEDCESAYFKMDNVLIDDRRIHVDFSQSVAKVEWKGKGTGTGYFQDKKDYKEKGGKFEAEKQGSNLRFTKTSRKGEGYDLLLDDENEEATNGKYELIKKQKRYQDDGGDRREQYASSSSRHDNSRYKEERRDREKDDRSGSKRYHNERDRSRERGDRDREDRTSSKSQNKDRDRSRERRDKDRDEKSSSKSHKNERERSGDRSREQRDKERDRDSHHKHKSRH